MHNLTVKPAIHICSLLLLSDDFLGAASSSSHLDLTPHTSIQPPPTSTGAGTTPKSPEPSLSEEHDATPSASGESVSLPTLVEVQPEPAAAELAKRLREASLEDLTEKTQEEQRPGKSDLHHEAEGEAVSQPEVTVDGAPVQPPAPSSKPEAAKGEGPQDLRVFELNSDSGKSTPSNNGKKGRMRFFSAAGNISTGFGSMTPNGNLKRTGFSVVTLRFPLNKLRIRIKEYLMS